MSWSNSLGKQLSFVYDVADLYKTELTIPVAFEVTAGGEQNIEKRVRQLFRERLKQMKLLQRILPDLDTMLQIDDNQPEADIFDLDKGLPATLWDEVEEGENW